MTKVHLRQGLLALARDERIYDPLTLRLLHRAGYVRSDGVTTEAGRAAAARARYEEAMWALYRRLFPEEALLQEHQGLMSVEETLPPDIVADLRAHLGLTPAEASA